MGSSIKNTGIIGAGKIAFSFAPALVNAGYNIDFIFSRNAASAEKLARVNGTDSLTGNLSAIPKSTRLIFLSVPDDKIESTALEIAQTNNNLAGKTFIHLSGSKNIAILEPLREKGAATGSFHIMQTFPGKERVNLAGAYCAIETDENSVREVLYNLAKSLGLIPISVPSEAKMLYHLTGVFTSNFMIANYFNAEACGKGIPGLNEPASGIVDKTVKRTLENIKTYGPAKALSGPAERGDTGVIKGHIDALKKLAESNPETGKTALLSYLSQTLTLLEAIKVKKGSLGPEHIDIKQIAEKELKELITKF